MKKILLSFLFVSFLSAAEGIAWINNNAGGKIIITNEVCKDLNGKVYKKLNRIYMYTSEGITIDGCFYIADDLVNAVWVNGTQMKYPVSDFILYEKKVVL